MKKLMIWLKSKNLISVTIVTLFISLVAIILAFVLDSEVSFQLFLASLGIYIGSIALALIDDIIK